MFSTLLSRVVSGRNEPIYKEIIFENQKRTLRVNKIKKHFDTATIVIIVITFVLFTIALSTKGFTHDLLLEAGVFLVSVKLILVGYKNSITTQKVLNELSELKRKD